MISDLPTLKKFLKLCREHGVTEIEFGGVKMKLGDMPGETVQEAEPQAMEFDEAEMAGIVGMHGIPAMAFAASEG